MARKGGRILLFGGLPKDDCTPPVDMNLIHYNALSLIGTTTFAPRHYRLAVKLVASNRIPVDKLITHRFPLADFQQGATMALEARCSRQSSCRNEVAAPAPTARWETRQPHRTLCRHSHRTVLAQPGGRPGEDRD
jgi:hypothetical protein